MDVRGVWVCWCVGVRCVVCGSVGVGVWSAVCGCVGCVGCGCVGVVGGVGMGVDVFLCVFCLFLFFFPVFSFKLLCFSLLFLGLIFYHFLDFSILGFFQSVFKNWKDSKVSNRFKSIQKIKKFQK